MKAEKVRFVGLRETSIAWLQQRKQLTITLQRLCIQNSTATESSKIRKRYEFNIRETAGYGVLYWVRAKCMKEGAVGVLC
jgi:hypothetical protein